MNCEDTNMFYEELETEEELRSETNAIRPASFTPEERLRIFNGCSFLTKGEIIEDVFLQVIEAEKLMETAAGDQLQYLKAKCNFLKQFIRRIEDTVLFNKLEPWWAYRYLLSSRGATLELMHMNRNKVVISSEDDYFCIPDTTFTVVQHDAKTMSIEEYAQYVGRTEAAIRQALRRGKYRSAFKMGQEWRISELCQPNIERGYSQGAYEWHTTLSGIPKGFEYIQDPGFADINQDDIDKQSFLVYVYSWNEQKGHFHQLDKVEMERLEHFLIAHPLVIFKNDEKIYDRRRKTNA
ncbi:MAG: hypothetical protein K6G90_12775 [Clostridia bacterium]|nr:hypothetical protein [Clostridia bacterium]